MVRSTGRCVGSACILAFEMINQVARADGNVCAALPIETHFSSGLEGWTLVDAIGGRAEGEWGWEREGGNPGGYVRFSDAGSDGGFLSAPPAYLGNWSELDAVASILFDHRLIDQGSPTRILPYEIVLSGPGGSARFLGDTAPGATQWVNVEAPLKSNSWTVVSGSWAGLLQGVAAFRIRIEVVDGPGDVEGIDNVILGGNCCPWDLDGDAEVGIIDFLSLLAAWGPNAGHPADLDGDGDVGVVDFLNLLANWGPCP